MIIFNQGMLLLGSNQFLIYFPIDVRAKHLLTITSVMQETSDTENSGSTTVAKILALFPAGFRIKSGHNTKEVIYIVKATIDSSAFQFNDCHRGLSYSNQKLLRLQSETSRRK